MTSGALLVFDCETSGLFKPELPIHHKEQPWAVSIAAKLVNLKRETLDFFSLSIRSDGRKIDTGATAVHGVSSAEAGRRGLSEITVLGALLGFAAEASYAVGHNIEFDRKIVEGLLIRRERDTKFWVRPGLEFIDTIKPAAHACKLPTDHESNTYRYPSLDDACRILLNEPVRTGPHTSWDDVCRTERLFFYEVDKRLLDIPELVQ